jgi:hypothetical protein
LKWNRYKHRKFFWLPAAPPFSTSLCHSLIPQIIAQRIRRVSKTKLININSAKGIQFSFVLLLPQLIHLPKKVGKSTE